MELENRMTNLSLLEEAKGNQEELVNLRRRIHKNPETGFDLPHTLTIVEEELIKLGYKPERCGKSGLVATVGNPSGNCFLLRADMDALPILEETDLAFKSQNGKMHACGHDLHTTMLLGAARLLKAHEAELTGIVKLIFQPAEEIMLGASDMIENGCLENPKVDAGMMMHVMPALPLDDGMILISPEGKTLSSCDWFEITVTGKGGHGSTPHTTIDPIIAASNIHLALNEIQAREVATDDFMSLTVGEFHAGTTSNVIPEKAELKGTLRTYSDDTRVHVKERMMVIGESIGQAYRCQVEVKFLAGCPTLENDSDLVDLANRVLPTYIGESKLVPSAALSSGGVQMGSEDFAYFSKKIPTVMSLIAAADSRLSPAYPVHHPSLVLNEEIIPYGSTTYASVAMEWLKANK